MIPQFTEKTRDYQKWSYRYATAQGGRKTMIYATLKRIWDEMSPEEREFVNKTWRDPK